MGPHATPQGDRLSGTAAWVTGWRHIDVLRVAGRTADGMLGWALWNGRWTGLLATAVLFAFFDAKARHKERWLVEAFPEYPAYRQRVRRLIPPRACTSTSSMPRGAGRNPTRCSASCAS